MTQEATSLKGKAYRMAVRPIARIALAVMVLTGGLYLMIAPYLNWRDTSYYDAVNTMNHTSKYPNIRPRFRWPWEF